MREILFRAKTIDSESKWVEGFYNHIPCGRFQCDEHCIQTIMEDGRIGQLWNVDENTVGQFTGLTDKNGKKIFEGDIVKHYNNTQHPEQFEIGMVWWNDCHLCFKRTSYPASVYVWRGGIYEVIGNIHDHPELLKEET